VLLQGGWQDAFIRPTLAAYSRLVARGVPVALTVGPWTHAQGGGEGAKVLLTDALAWFDEHHDQAPARTEPVRFFTAGASEGWRTLAVWPPPTTNRTWHPRSDGALLESSTSSPDVREFRYDPADPTPTCGGAFVTSLSPGYEAGYVDDTELVQRPDVLSFTSEPLVGGLDILGAPMAHIAHSSDNPHADLFVRVSDIDESGRSRNVSDGFVRLDKGSTGPVRIDFEPTAYRVAPGHRIRFVIAGGSHPRWERNLGTDENPAISSRMVPSHRTIDLAGTQIVLPIDIASGRN
jgi:putative CocE/NonD family hydrolase